MNKENKKKIRNEILAIRKNMDRTAIETYSKIICEKLESQEIYKKAHDICIYMAIRNEVELNALAEAAWRDGKRVWLPKVIGEKMDFFRYTKETDFVEGAYGIKEPDSSEVLESKSEVLVVMPGAVFSRSKDRIGYGGGYYDRYLEEEKCMTVAVCYDFQVLDEIPHESHDIRPDMIVTEKGIVV